MIQAIGARAGIRVSAIAAGVVVACVFAFALAAPAFAQEGDTTIEVDPGTPVYGSTCKVCHGIIADGQDPRVIFSHASHILYPCASCHTVFPHSPAGTVKPTMKDCWNCHDLRHGPNGLIATGECEKCHGVYTGRMRPESHTPDWAEEPHVEPSLTSLRTECMMCHTRADCDECHREVGVEWRTAEPFTYDVEDGCLACHGDPNLAKFASPGVVRSLYVTGLDRTAHRDITCVECHVDFNYHDQPDETPMWRINAGLACADCHADEDVTAEWEQSLHGQLIDEGDYTSATCASCHGGHSIARLDTQAARDQLHLASEQMCAPCHMDEWENYDDWYHGRAYKRGALDAPACWDCHGSHEVLAVADPESLMYPTNAVETCAIEGCHRGTGETFIEHAADSIHGRYDAREDNPVVRWWRSFRGRG